MRRMIRSVSEGWSIICLGEEGKRSSIYGVEMERKIRLMRRDDVYGVLAYNIYLTHGMAWHGTWSFFFLSFFSS